MNGNRYKVINTSTLHGMREGTPIGTLDHGLVTLDYTNYLCKKIGLQVSSLSTYLDIVQRNLTQIHLNIMITMLWLSTNLKSDNGAVRNSHVIKLQRKIPELPG